jgi:hypothetical protein
MCSCQSVDANVWFGTAIHDRAARFREHAQIPCYTPVVGRQAGQARNPRYFNHNAVYHVLQAVGLFLIFVTARDIPVPTAGGAVIAEMAL